MLMRQRVLALMVALGVVVTPAVQAATPAHAVAEGCVKSGSAAGKQVDAKAITQAMGGLARAGVERQAAAQQVAHDWCLTPVTSYQTAVTTASTRSTSSGMVIPNSTSADAHSDQSDITFQNVTMFFDNDAQDYVASVGYTWLNQHYVKDRDSSGSLCGHGEGDVGGSDALGIAIGQLDTGARAFTALDSAAVFWGDHSVDNLDDNYGSTVVTTQAAGNGNGAIFEIQDKDESIGNIPCIYGQYDYNVYGGEATYVFYLDSGPCQTVQVHGTYDHTWDTTHITGIGIDLGGGKDSLSAGFQISWDTDHNKWPSYAPSRGNFTVCPTSDPTKITPPVGGVANDPGAPSPPSNPVQTRPRVVGDYDGDGYTDLALYRQDCTNGSTWWVRSTAAATQMIGGQNYGGCHDIPAPGDYDGDGYTDQGLYRQDCTNGSTWWVYSPHLGKQLYGGLRYGGCHDIPVPGDYDGDNRTDLALFRQDCTNGSSWWAYNPRTSTQILGGLKYGGCTDIPVPGDYDGDGVSDLALFRHDCTNGSTFWVRSTAAAQQIIGGVKFGGCNDIPTPGDYDGDGKADLALFRQDCTNGSSWWVRSTGTASQFIGNLKGGGCHDIPAAGDYDGDGRADLGLFRHDCTNGSTWWAYSPRAGAQVVAGVKYGGCADLPATAT
jgi:hypothetical protein